MLPQSSTARNLEPKFYIGGGTRFYLPLLHDIMALEKPPLVVTRGLADAQGEYPSGTWVRNPPGYRRSLKSADGAAYWVKRGHLGALR